MNKAATIKRSAGHIGLVVILGVLCIRLTYPEGLAGGATNLALMNFTDTAKGLSLSLVLLLAAVAGLVRLLSAGRFGYRLTWFEIGTGVFISAAVISIYLASNKRAAINTSIILIPAMITGILLVNLLTTVERIRFVLIVITSLGVLNSFICIEQYFSGNEQMIAVYEENPQEMLSNLGIKEGTLEHFMLEHRIYSKDIKGYFLTGNSAASFFLLSAASCGVLLSENLRKDKRYKDTVNLITNIIAFILIVVGLFLTRSKGGIGGGMIALAVFLLFLSLRNFIKKYRKFLLVISIIFFIFILFFISAYGSENGRLPGGNSMLVRWQYWQSSAEMAYYNPLGVGGGNFATHYTMYKNPASPETVRDPHNFILSLLCQYGWIGLSGFLAAVSAPVLKIVLDRNSEKELQEAENNYIKFGNFLPVLVLTVVGWFFCKDVDFGGNLDVAIYLSILFFIVPAAVLFFCVLLLWPKKDQSVNRVSLPYSILVCAVAGFLVHNLVDFAIFEPGVWLCFWTILAVIIAFYRLSGDKELKTVKLSNHARLITGLLSVAGFAGIFYCCYLPVVSTAYIQSRQVQKFRNLNKPNISLWSASENVYIHSRLDDILQKLGLAICRDKVDPVVCSVRGKLAVGAVEMTSMEVKFLNVAMESFQQAIYRDPLNYKHYENLARVYVLLSRLENKQENLAKALEELIKAVDLYPSSGKVHFKLAQVADELNENILAVEHYKRAVEIEESFRAQFKVMYPEIEIVSRLGKDKYKTSLQRIKKLSSLTDE